MQGSLWVNQRSVCLQMIYGCQNGLELDLYIYIAGIRGHTRVIPDQTEVSVLRNAYGRREII